MTIRSFTPSRLTHRFHREVLSILQNECSAFPVFTPADTTWAIQLVDDGRGKAFRNDIYSLFDELLSNFDFAANPRGALSAMERRIMTAQFVQKTFDRWAADERQNALTIKAATRTGLRMEREHNFDKIVPVKSVHSVRALCIR